MATPLSLTIPQQTFPVGTSRIGPRPFPVGYTQAYIVVDRTQLNASPSTVMDVLIDVSQDAGTTWTRAGSTTMRGGSRLDPDTGQTVMSDDLYVGGIWHPENANRQVRVTLNVSGASAVFSGSLTLT